MTLGSFLATGTSVPPSASPGVWSAIPSSGLPLAPSAPTGKQPVNDPYLLNVDTHLGDIDGFSGGSVISSSRSGSGASTPNFVTVIQSSLTEPTVCGEVIGSSDKFCIADKT
ncbi:hypothetical protein ACA910_014956 [Epithemia clementina (nom. ined.)]